MRHLVKGRKLGRTASHRKATMMALSVALIKNERIVTTLAKAKALRSYVEPIITRSKQDSTHNRSHVFRHLRDKQATSRLFDEIAPMVEERPGGYTRIVKLGVRPGDGVETAMIEMVDFNDAQPETSRKKKRRTRRGGSGGKKAADKAPDSPQKVSKPKESQAASPAKDTASKEKKAADDQPRDEKAEKADTKTEAVAEKKKTDEQPAEKKASVESERKTSSAKEKSEESSEKKSGEAVDAESSKSKK